MAPSTLWRSFKDAPTAQMELVMSVFMLIQSFTAISALIWRIPAHGVERLIINNGSLSRPQFASWSGIRRRVAAFTALMKPRVMLLSVFTAVVGLMIAPTHVDPILGTIAIFAIAGGAGAAGALNMWYDADIDSVMSRTALRPIPLGRVSRLQALLFGLILAVSSVSVLGFMLNVTAAALLATAIIFYVVIYTVWLKRRIPQNIVIGGAAGALPPVIGWTAATGYLGIEPVVLFLIIFLWTPPHFWALSLNRSDEYARAGIPMLPVVFGSAATARQILIYSICLVPVSTLPTILGFAGLSYGETAVLCGAVLLVLAAKVDNRGKLDRKAAHRLFAFSIVYLFVLFAALLTSSNNRGLACSGVVSARAWISSQVCQGSRALGYPRYSKAEHDHVSRPCLTVTCTGNLYKLYRIVYKLIRRGLYMHRSLRALVVLIALVPLGGCGEGILDPQGPIASAERQVLFNSLAIMLAIVIPTIVAILAVGFWFRSSNSRARYLPDFNHSGLLEVLVWSIPAMTVLLVGGVAWLGAHELDPHKALRSTVKPVAIQVVSLDWKWLFIYRDEGIASVNYLRIPAGRPVSLELTSAGVMNSFFVPQLGGQIYTMAGMLTNLQLLADHPGTYRGMSAQFSGDGFADMHFNVDAVDAGKFAEWVSSVRSAGPELDATAYARLTKPSAAIAPFTYRAVGPGLFDGILASAMQPEDAICLSHPTSMRAEK